MNLNKFTKAELISKIKGLKNNPENQTKFWSYLLIIKSFLVKFTLLAFIIKFFKKYSIIRRIYVVINAIVMSIFGISMLDFYGLSFISAFIAEISSITGNIVNYLSNTRFYSYLAGILGYKIEPVKESSTMISVNTSSTGIQTENKRIDKVSEWFNRQEEVKDNTPFYQNKYFIYGTIFVASCLTYYYFGDDIRVYTLTAWNWLRGRRDGDNPPINPPIQSNNSNLMVNNEATNEGWSFTNPIKNIWGYGKRKIDWNKVKEAKEALENITEDEDAIEVTESARDYYFNPEEREKAKGKTTVKSVNLTSPSLDNLNAQAEDSWNRTRTSSPESINSTETVKPSKVKLTSNVTEGNNNSSSSNVFNHDEIPKSMIEKTVEKLDSIYNENGKIRPFFKSPSKIKNLNSSNWTDFVTEGIKEKMEYIEKTWDSEEDLTKEIAFKLTDELAVIHASYNTLVEVYDESKPKLTEKNTKVVKEMAFYMRNWISKYSSKIITKGEITLNPGYYNDSPKNITKDILGED